MAKIITITNGEGSAPLNNGTYSVSASSLGYDASTISPSSVTVVEGTNSYAFTIGANGTLTLHVSEDGTVSGTPIVGATFVRTDQGGNEYGSAITTDSNGDAVFNNVPYDLTNAPTIYYKQTASDGDHNFDNTVQSTTLTTQSETVEVTNTPYVIRTIALTDANYTNLPITSAQITLS